MGLLDHPLETAIATHQINNNGPVFSVVTLRDGFLVVLPDLGDLYRVLCGSSGVVLDLELLHQFVESAERWSQNGFLLLLGAETVAVTSYNNKYIKCSCAS